MKFGETLYQRSVPQWAAYNVNYNEIKRLIKERTSSGLAVPVSIPSGSSQNRWEALEDELYDILKDQHDNISLFLKSKYGEIDRRLNYLEKQVRSSLKSAQLSHARSNVQDRKHRKLLEDAESIGQDIQNLTRFAGVQKTAIRKILKKYRKWTGSLTLQTRLENEVFSAGQLNLDYAHPLDRLAAQIRIVKEELQGLRLDEQSDGPPTGRIYSPVNASTSTASEIKLAEEKSPLALDAALATVPFGKSSGSATYWIHPDNLDEAQALMLRHVREIHNPDTRRMSTVSANSKDSVSTTASSVVDGNYIAYFDNPQRFIQDTAANRPSKIALSGRWCQNTDGIVTLSNLAPWNPAGTIVKVKRKDMFRALNRDTAGSQRGRKQSRGSDNVQRVQEYLAEHRDVKPQSQICSTRSRYVGTTNSASVGVWATLDSDIIISPVFNEHSNSINENVESGEAFPHAVLEVRWEFCHTPELIRAFDTTHLAERVKGFTLESAAVYATNNQVQPPPWKALLEKDIRKVPITTKLSSVRGGSASRMRTPVVGSSSGPSSTDGPPESILSAQNVQSSATSVASPDEASRDMKSLESSLLIPSSPSKKKKRARIDAQSPPPRVSRYWNEFDDGDEDVNPNEAYTIYVDPNASFPGAETVSKAFGAMYKSLYNTSSRVSSMLSLKSQTSPKRKAITSERSPLINPSGSNHEDGTSSDSDTSPNEGPRISFGTLPKLKKHSRGPSTASTSLYRPNPILTPRQQALERAYLMSSAGLAVLSYVILFICGVLVSTGRKRSIIEIDIAMIAGIATAVTCAVISTILLLMRKTSLSLLQWSLVAVVVAGVLGLGVAEIVAVVKKPRS